MPLDPVAKVRQPSILHVLRRFSRAERGAVSVEAVLWVPFLLFLFAAIADISFIFFNQSRVLRVVQDANRNVSVGRLTNQLEVNEFIQRALGNLGQSATINTSVEAGYITSEVTIPARDLDGLGVVGAFRSLNVTVRASHLQEI